MSLPPHREKDAKVEGRDPPETVKKTMAPFKSLVERLLKVPMSEVRERQASYNNSREAVRVTLKPKKRKLKSASTPAPTRKANAPTSAIKGSGE